MLPAEFLDDLTYVSPNGLSSATADALGSAWALRLKMGYLTSFFSQGSLRVDTAPLKHQEGNTCTCVRETAACFSPN